MTATSNLSASKRLAAFCLRCAKYRLSHNYKLSCLEVLEC